MIKSYGLSAVSGGGRSSIASSISRLCTLVLRGMTSNRIEPNLFQVPGDGIGSIEVSGGGNNGGNLRLVDLSRNHRRISWAVKLVMRDAPTFLFSLKSASESPSSAYGIALALSGYTHTPVFRRYSIRPSGNGGNHRCRKSHKARKHSKLSHIDQS